MHALRHHRRAFSGFAIVAILALALVPTVSRGLAAAQGGSAWVEICTPQGTKVAGTDDQPTRTAARHLDHCALCGLAGQALVPALMRAALRWAPPLAEPPTPSLHAPRPLFAWTAAQARAPPFGLA